MHVPSTPSGAARHSASAAVTWEMQQRWLMAALGLTDEVPHDILGEHTPQPSKVPLHSTLTVGLNVSIIPTTSLSINELVRVANVLQQLRSMHHTSQLLHMLNCHAFGFVQSNLIIDCVTIYM